MDTRIRGDATESFAEDNAQYDLHKNEFSKAVAFGVGFILLGVTIYEFLMGIPSQRKLCKYAVSYHVRGIRPAIRGSRVER